MDNKRPKKLYKYQPFNNWSQINLKNRCIWFSKPTRFNDPFDCSIRLSFENVPEEEWLTIYEHFLKEAKENMKEKFSEEDSERKYLSNGKTNKLFKDIIKSKSEELFFKQEKFMMNERGVACFSDKVDDILMWSHYSEGHRGFCIELNTDYEPLNDNIRLFKVMYSDSIPTVSLVDIFVNKEEEAIKPLMAMITTKSNHWSYENEWRLFHMKGDQSIHMNPKAFTAIYFGCMMPFDHKEIIAMILRDSPTKLYEISRSDDKFSVRYEKVEYKPFNFKTK